MSMCHGGSWGTREESFYLVGSRECPPVNIASIDPFHF
jgi:hypothetical protein